MEKQLIISVGRQFGSAGHVIAKELAKRFDLPYFDNNLLEHVAKEKNMDHAELAGYDEKPTLGFLNKKVRGYSASPQENVAQLQFDFLRNMAAEGKSFVIVGRCADDILKEYPGLISIFLMGDEEEKIKRVMETDNLSRQKAILRIKQKDAKRREYHNAHCKSRWGEAEYYDLLLNCSDIGIEKASDLLEDYIKIRMENM